AKANIPIIASVSEHQPTAWASYFFDLHILIMLVPAGIFYCIRDATDATIFAVLYGTTSIYFSGVMVRLMLVLAPISCVLAGIAASKILSTYTSYITSKETKSKNSPANFKYSKEIGTLVIAGVTILLIFYTLHCTKVTSQAYSSPSVVL